MNRKLVLIGVILLLAFYGCRDDEHFDFSQLQGNWECVSAESGQCESWSVVGEKEYLGMGYVLDGPDTIFVENLSIVFENGNWVFRTKTGDIMDPIPFQLNFQNKSRVEFVNPTMDFPKKIGYEVFSTDSMQSYYEGPRDGQNVRVMFDMVRTKN
jgi:hypothetical protein